ncbi:hypothetical protein [Globicatella sanguinis]
MGKRSENNNRVDYLSATQLCGGRPTKRKLFDFLLLAHSLNCRLRYE